ncbi:MAG: NTP transferase domain-containing protein [Clostridiales bacterium]|nr:NTP transferase domain-containing protein [Clostridiales bacterium]
MNIGLVLAGGIGSRFGSKTPKQYMSLCGKEVISYSISALLASKTINKVIIVAQEEQTGPLSEKYNVIAVKGGSSRNESLKNGLDYIYKNFDCKNIIILEAARPMVTPKIIDEYISRLSEYDAVITGQRIVDSLGKFGVHTVDRSEYYLIQAPEAFRFDLLYENFKAASPITATNQQLPENSKVYINFDFINNHKITYFADLAYCEAMLKGNE